MKGGRLRWRGEVEEKNKRREIKREGRSKGNRERMETL